MTHPDPRLAEIQDRNSRAYAEAVQAPPPEIADDPAAYLAWVRQKPAVQARPQRPRTFVDYRRPTSTVIRRPGRLSPPTPQELETERNRQLNALEALIAQDEPADTPKDPA